MVVPCLGLPTCPTEPGNEPLSLGPNRRRDLVFRLDYPGLLRFGSIAGPGGRSGHCSARLCETSHVGRKPCLLHGRRCTHRQDFAAWPCLEQDFPVPCDWFLQDLAACGLPFSLHAGDLRSYPARWFSAAADDDVEQRLILKAAEELGPAGQPIRSELERLKRSQSPPHGRAWLDLYVRSCEARRSARLRAMALKCPALVFTKHANLGGSHYAYTEAQSDAQAERHFNPGSALCLLEMRGGEPHVRTLLEDPDGMIRDPDVSYDGRRVLFAWKKSDRLDDFHLYEMDLASGAVRQLTFGLGLCRLRRGLSARRRHHFQLDPLRADGRLLHHRGQQPLYAATATAGTCAAWDSTRCTRTSPP